MAVAMNQILTDWTTPSGGGKVTVMYFSAAGDINDQRIAVDNLFKDIGVGLDDSVSYQVRQEGVVLNDVDGALLDSWVDNFATGSSGDGTGQVVADATQVLIRWSTDTVVNGRFLKGRTFVPGLGNGNEANGNLATAAVATFQGVVDDFIAADVGFGVWSRPVRDPETHALVRDGLWLPATGGSVWSELAVLRRRRG